jgi:outer membrane protein assembly factor BamB
VAHNGAIYTTGYTIRQVGNIGLRRMVMSKLDASTGDVIWSRTGLTDWPQTSDFVGGDLIVDDNSLLALYYGSETGNAVGNAIKLYLQKTTLDGEVLWVKKYDLAAFPKELVATPDGYVIFAGAITRTFLKPTRRAICWSPKD